MTSSYLPRPDGHFDAWAENFVAYAAEHQEALGLAASDVAKLESLRKQWADDYANHEQQQALASAAAASKTDSRAVFERQLRAAAREIQARSATTDAERGALGLTIPDMTPTRVGPPETRPILSIDASQRLRHSLHFVDEATPTRRAKPHGVASIQIWTAVRAAGAPAPTDPADFRFAGLATRTPTRIELTGADAGKTAYYMARWVNARAVVGPWSAIAMATVGA